ncbi:MAG: sulfite exporter TauE/SafE family protein [Actinomycetota bacterium]|nr:sulfite exporter TauE/SafE family protein [Actinomycetota bacterium]
MTWLEAVGVLLAGMAAGTVNTIVGSGTLVTFPTLLALGFPPVVANVSNTVGLVPGSLSGAIGYRRELAGQRSRLLRLGAASLLGGLGGGILLLILPAAVFDAVVPALILLGCALVVAQPWVSRKVAAPRDGPAHGSVWVWLLVFAAGVYGGYFGAAQGVLLVAILGIGLAETMQRVNAAKNVLALTVNAVAALLFIAVAEVDWRAAGLIAAGAVVGGQIGATVGRRLSPLVLRAVIVVVGVVAAVDMLR